MGRPFEASTLDPFDGEVALLTSVIEAQSAIAEADPDPHGVMRVIVERAVEVTRSTGAVVEVLDGAEMVSWVASGGLADEIGLRLDATRTLSGQCVRTGTILRCDDAERDPRVDGQTCRRLGVRSILVAPLTHRGDVVGVLKVVSTQPSAYTDAHVRALELMVRLVGVTLARAATYSSALRLAAAPMDRGDVVGTSAPVRELRRIIDERDLRVVFQPIVDLTTHDVSAVEALARFDTEPAIGPEGWFATASREGLGEELEVAAVEAALREVAAFPANCAIALNVSPQAVVRPDLRAAVEGADPSRIILEITEHAAIEDYDIVRNGIAPLRRDGVQLAIDDAGAGFASFRHILNLEPDVIKLDISLTRDIATRPRQRTLASALVSFASGTGAKVLAEGIERHDELETLREVGVTLGQGFLLGVPVPADLIEVSEPVVLSGSDAWGRATVRKTG